jgi:hypothetical protein
MWGHTMPTETGYEMRSVTTEDYERTWIALNQVVGGIPDFEGHICKVVPVKGNLLAIEGEADGFRVSLRKRTSRGLADQTVWSVRLDDDSYSVLSVNDVNGKAASRTTVAELNDTLWQFHRLAVEDTAAVIRD